MFLIKNTYKERIDFQFTGIQNAPKVEQLQNFVYALSLAKGKASKISSLSNWVEAFIQNKLLNFQVNNFFIP